LIGLTFMPFEIKGTIKESMLNYLYEMAALNERLTDGTSWLEDCNRCTEISSDGSGSKIVWMVWVGSIFCWSGWVSHLWFGFGKFCQKVPSFPIFSLRVKKIASGQVKKYPVQGWVGLLFTAGQKYDQLRQAHL